MRRPATALRGYGFGVPVAIGVPVIVGVLFGTDVGCGVLEGVMTAVGMAVGITGIMTERETGAVMAPQADSERTATR